MVEITTRIFGDIAIEDDKIIHFERGILGFPDLKDFTLIFDIEKGNKEDGIKWLQSIDEPGFAMPVMNPSVFITDYEPRFDRDLLTPLGDNLEPANIAMFVTVTVPKGDVTGTTINLKAPIIISLDSNRAVQLISDGDEYSIKYPIYEEMQKRKRA